MPSNENIKSGSGCNSGELDGSFFLQLEFKRGEASSRIEPLQIEPQHIKEFTITLDINRFMPAFHLVIDDAAGLLTHIFPFDKNMSRFHVQIGSVFSCSIDDTTLYTFDVYRRKPTSRFIYDVSGLLSTTGLFSPGRGGAYTCQVDECLTTLGAHMGADSVEIGTNLDYKKTILQPGWSDAKLLNWMKNNIIGSNNESGYYSFMKCVGNKKVFVFKSVNDFVKQAPKHKFTFSTSPVEDADSGEIYFPILDYQLYDNYKALGVKGSRRQELDYYNYNTSAFTHTEYEIDNNEDPQIDYPSFTTFHMIDKDDSPVENIGNNHPGRSNGFTTDFKGRALNSFHHDLTNMSKIWIDVLGMEDIYPGDIIETFYLEETPPDGVTAYQHQGYWLVERVVHVIKNTFISRLLLTRNGVEAGMKTTLMRAKNPKR